MKIVIEHHFCGLDFTQNKGHVIFDIYCKHLHNELLVSVDHQLIHVHLADK